MQAGCAAMLVRLLRLLSLTMMSLQRRMLRRMPVCDGCDVMQPAVQCAYEEARG
jgi:hypothetical protein